jgi:signal transduction histidine kinase
MQALSARLLAASAERATLEEIIRDAATSMTEARRSVAGLRGGGVAPGLASAIEHLYRSRRSPQLLCDLGVRQALGDQAQYLNLARR